MGAGTATIQTAIISSYVFNQLCWLHASQKGHSTDGTQQATASLGKAAHVVKKHKHSHTQFRPDTSPYPNLACPWVLSRSLHKSAGGHAAAGPGGDGRQAPGAGGAPCVATLFALAPALAPAECGKGMATTDRQNAHLAGVMYRPWASAREFVPKLLLRSESRR